MFTNSGVGKGRIICKLILHFLRILIEGLDQRRRDTFLGLALPVAVRSVLEVRSLRKKVYEM